MTRGLTCYMCRGALRHTNKCLRKQQINQEKKFNKEKTLFVGLSNGGRNAGKVAKIQLRHDLSILILD